MLRDIASANDVQVIQVHQINGKAVGNVQPRHAAAAVVVDVVVVACYVHMMDLIGYNFLVSAYGDCYQLKSSKLENEHETTRLHQRKYEFKILKKCLNLE